MRALGTVLEPFWRVLGPLLVDFPTRGEGPGRLPEVMFEVFFLDVLAERQKKTI